MIYYITGGARSGKSSHASRLALELSNSPVYVATARRWDKDFNDRITRHEQDRDERWTTIEEEKNISGLNLEGKVAVIDCITLWLTNYFVDYKYDIDCSLLALKKEVDLLADKNTTYIIISNEIGMGVHSESESGRKFVDLQGWTNQYIAQKADHAIFMVSGLPLKLK